jgi:hypothetical protein
MDLAWPGGLHIFAARNTEASAIDGLSSTMDTEHSRILRMSEMMMATNIHTLDLGFNKMLKLAINASPSPDLLAGQFVFTRDESDVVLTLFISW